MAGGCTEPGFSSCTGFLSTSSFSGPTQYLLMDTQGVPYTVLVGQGSQKALHLSCALGSLSPCPASSAIHLEVKPFKCHTCAKAFTRASGRATQGRWWAERSRLLALPSPLSGSRRVGPEQLSVLRGHRPSAHAARAALPSRRHSGSSFGGSIHTLLLGTPGMMGSPVEFLRHWPNLQPGFQSPRHKPSLAWKGL